jgi:hypothetical protein
MSQFKGMSHDKIEGIFYRIKRQDSDFIPIDFEEEERRFHKSKSKATASEQKMLDRYSSRLFRPHRI